MTVHFSIEVPCSSANIGPGFDVVGLALSMFLTLDVQIDPTDSNKVTLKYTGEGANEVPLEAARNLITRVSTYVLRCHGQHTFPGSVLINVHNDIPFGRGLGSSGASVVAGVLLGDAILQRCFNAKPLPKERLMDFCLMVERHPDNVAAALVGGFVGSYLKELDPQDTAAKEIPLSEVLPMEPSAEEQRRDLPPPPLPPSGIGHWIRFGWAKEIRAITIIPQFELATAKARSVLPSTYDKKDLIFNLQRLAVLTTALTRSPPDPELIFQAMQDKVHQPYRKELIPGLPRILASVTPKTHPGLLGICLSGAGPTILALATENFDSISNVIVSVFKEEGIDVKVKILDITESGAAVVDL